MQVRRRLRIAVERDARDREQRPQHDLQLGLRERRRRAVVRAVTECQVRIGASVQSEPIGVGEPSGVAVRAREPDDDGIARGDLLPRELAAVGQEPPGRHAEGAVEPQELVDGRLPQRRVLAQSAHLGRMTQQCDRRHGELVGDRLLSCHQQLEHDRARLVGGDAAALRRADDARDRRVRRKALAIPGEHAVEVVAEAVEQVEVGGAAGVCRTHRLHGAAPRRIERVGEGVRERERVHEDEPRVRARDGVEQVEALRQCRRERFGVRSDPGAQPGGRAVSERSRHESAQDRVARLVTVQQMRLERGVERLGHDRGSRAPMRVAVIVIFADAAVGERLDGGVVPRDDPRSDGGEAHRDHGTGRAHPGVRRVRIGVVLSSGEIERLGAGMTGGSSVRTSHGRNSTRCRDRVGEHREQPRRAVR